MNIPPHIQTALNVAASITKEQLEDVINNWPISQAAFGLATDDFCAAASDVDDGVESMDVAALTRAPTDWKYIELLLEGTRECFGVCTPKSSAGVPPTAAGQAVLKAWFEAPVVLNGDLISEGFRVRGLARDVKNRIFATRLIDTWAEACLSLEGSRVPPLWIIGSQILLRNDSRILLPQAPGVTYENLFFEALSESKAKWRYLSLYRILENGYLTEVLDSLKVEFLFSPKESLRRASDALESELNQFVSLAETASVTSEFEAFDNEFERVKASNNRFAAAIDRSIQQSGQLKTLSGKCQHGVLVCYKIRCAVVHAGLLSPIFDAYPDGSACLEMLLPTLESIVLKYLGITIV